MNTEYEATDEEAIYLPGGDAEELPPEGEYPGVVRLVKKANSQSSGKPMLIVELELWDGERFHELTDFISFAAKFRMKPFINAVVPGHAGGPVLPSKMADTEVRLLVNHDEYGGEKVLRVKRYLPVDPNDALPENAKPVSNDQVGW